jgi:hypothetical protein
MNPPNNSPRNHRKKNQSTLVGVIQENNTQPPKTETQPDTRPVKEGELRVYFQNIHGIKPTTREWEDMITKIEQNKIGIFGFAETNYNWTPIAERLCINKAKRALRRETGKWTNLSLNTSACSGWVGGDFQPGGTCTGAIGGWATRISCKESDPERLGRWSSIGTRLKGVEITIITAYRVGKTSINLENNNAYVQQWKELKFRGVNKPDPRKKTLEDLKKFIKKEIEKQKEIILMIDANESVENRTEEMNRLIYECELIDPHLMSQPFAEIETYARGKTKIDFMFVTSRIFRSITYTQICPYHEIIQSDHRALILDIDLQKLEVCNLNDFSRPERNIISSNRRCRNEFVTRCKTKADQHDWLRRLEKIKKEDNLDVLERKLNNLDDEVTRSLTTEAENLKKKRKPRRSAELNKAILNHQMWRIALSGIRTKRCFNSRLNILAKKLNIPENQEEWKQPKTVASRCREANKVRRQKEKEERQNIMKERDDMITKNLPEGSKIESALRDFKFRQQQKMKYQLIKESIRGQRSSAINHISIPEPYQRYPYNPDDVQEWKKEYDLDKIETILADRNCTHFQQAQGTPFATKEMLETFPFTADSVAAEEVLQGHDIEGPTLEATEILKECRRKICEEEEEIKYEDIRIGFKQWKERTSTSPSGMHLGIYRCFVDLNEQKEEKIHLLKVISEIINTAMSRGVTIRRWCQVHNVMLEKDPND